MEVQTWRARFRLRLAKKLNIAESERRLTVADREVVLASGDIDGKPIKESVWLVMNTRGFKSEHDARDFAERLKLSAELASVSCRLGIDAGINIATSGLGAAFKSHLEQTTGAVIRSNVHGIDVFPDDPNVTIFSFHGEASVLAGPDPFLDGINSLHGCVDTASQRARDIALLLNYALMRTEPVAQIVFAVSAVEMLGQDEEWNVDQKRLLADLAEIAQNARVGTVEERREVAEAITKSLHRISLRQGVRRLLENLGLAHLKKPWDDLYGERSTLVHGLAPKPGENYSKLADRTMALCGQILLRAIAVEIELVGKLADTHYGIPQKPTA